MDNTYNNHITYDAFISYRTSVEKDKKYAIALHTFLETFFIPKKLANDGLKKKIERVFRDVDELTVGDQLKEPIKFALANSNCLFIICSNSVNDKHWINDEMKIFIEIGKIERIIPVLIEGTVESAFPSVLLEQNKSWEFIDLRGIKPNKIPDKLKISIISRCLDCSYDQLFMQFENRKFRRRIVLSSVIIGLLSGLFLFCFLQLQHAESLRQKSLDVKNTSMGIISSLTYNIPNQLSSIPNTMPVIVKILNDNIEKIAEIIGSIDDVNSRKEMAYNYSKAAEIYNKIGNSEKSSVYYLKLINVYEQLVEVDQTETLKFFLMDSYLSYSDSILYNGQYRYYDEAKKYLDKCSTMLDDKYSDVDRLNMLCAEYYNNRGLYDVFIGYKQQGLEHFERCLSILDASFRETNEGIAGLYAKSYFNLSKVYYDYANYQKAEDNVQKSIGLLELYGIDKSFLSTNYLLLGNIYLQEKSYDQALQQYKKSEIISVPLTSDQSNLYEIDLLSNCYNCIGTAYYEMNNTDDAVSYFEKSLDICNRKIRSDDVADSKKQKLYLNLANFHFNNSQYEKAENYYMEYLKTDFDLNHNESKSDEESNSFYDNHFVFEDSDAPHFVAIKDDNYLLKANDTLSSKAYLNLLWCLIVQNYVGDSTFFQEAERGESLDPNNRPAFEIYMAHAYLLQDSYAKSKELYSKVIEKYGEEYRSYIINDLKYLQKLKNSENIRLVINDLYQASSPQSDALTKDIVNNNASLYLDLWEVFDPYYYKNQMYNIDKLNESALQRTNLYWDIDIKSKAVPMYKEIKHRLSALFPHTDIKYMIYTKSNHSKSDLPPSVFLVCINGEPIDSDKYDKIFEELADGSPVKITYIEIINIESQSFKISEKTLSLVKDDFSDFPIF